MWLVHVKILDGVEKKKTKKQQQQQQQQTNPRRLLNYKK